MTILVGVDLEGNYRAAVPALARLEFTEPRLVFVQVAPSALVFTQYPLETTAVAQIEGAFEQGGKATLEEAVKLAREHRLTAETRFAFGSPVECLNDFADHLHADLVAVRSVHHGFWQAELLGSVSRGVLLSGRAGLLVVRDEPSTQGAFDAVFAVDGSERQALYVSRFLSLAPKGIGTIHVGSAWGVSSHIEEFLRRPMPHSEEAMKGMEHAAQRCVDEAREQLDAAGYKTAGHVLPGSPNAALHGLMQDTGSQLLIVGDHGKGFVERLLAGSVALHQIMCESYSVLVVRTRA